VLFTCKYILQYPWTNSKHGQHQPLRAKILFFRLRKLCFFFPRKKGDWCSFYVQYAVPRVSVSLGGRKGKEFLSKGKQTERGGKRMQPFLSSFPFPPIFGASPTLPARCLRCTLTRWQSGLPDLCWYVIPKPEKMYRISTKYSKWS
jgi:hypothetical protein